MRKMKQIPFFGLMIAAMLLFMVTSCTKEGPEGPAGTDGVDGEDAVVSCLECHESGDIAVIQAEFNTSGHYAGEAAVDYAGARGDCAECHSHEGFVEYTSTGSIAGDISAPSAWECGTCHGLHTNFDSTDYGFRITEPITFIYDETTSYDFGNSNLCAFCHQSRRAGPEDEGGGNFEITSTHWGPHHGAQGNLLAGVGFAEISGSASYPTGAHTHGSVSCTGCHMGDYNADNNQGGHSFNASVDACNSCHTSSNFTDFEGAQAGVIDKLDELEALLYDAGVVDTVGGETHVIPGTYPLVQAQAYYNWIGIAEDRSGGLHHPSYINALLDNSIEALTVK